MAEKVNVKFNGGVEGSIHFQCPGVSARNINPGDIISNIPKEVYESDLKNDPRYTLVTEKTKEEIMTNKKEKQTFSKGEN